LPIITDSGTFSLGLRTGVFPHAMAIGYIHRDHRREIERTMPAGTPTGCGSCCPMISGAAGELDDLDAGRMRDFDQRRH
jgi:hypothetical protein